MNLKMHDGQNEQCTGIPHFQIGGCIEQVEIVDYVLWKFPTFAHFFLPWGA